MSSNAGIHNLMKPVSADMDEVFRLCRANDWDTVLLRLQQNPLVGCTPVIMVNHISTTVIHQAITSKGDTQKRARVITQILQVTPQIAKVKNGYGSLPLHVISQRNTKMDAKTKEKLMFGLVSAYKGGLTEQGGVGKRTPLHVVFTDYISPRLTQMMIDFGEKACFMKDKKGWLPAHVAASRHVSPEKLNMLLKVNPGALFDKTAAGETLLNLAESTATKTHPNNALVDMLKREMVRCQLPPPQRNDCATPPAAGGHYAAGSSNMMGMNPAVAAPFSLVSPLARSGSESDDNNAGAAKLPSSQHRVMPVPLHQRKRKHEETSAVAEAAFPPPDRGARLLLDFSRGGGYPDPRLEEPDSKPPAVRIEEV